MSKSTTYSIYADRRPIKVAYLLNFKKLDIEILFQIIKRNQECWGGRFTPIFELKNGILNSEQLDFLKQYDPDVVKTIGEIKIKTISKISAKTTPYHFDETPINDYVRYDIDDERLEFLPTPEFISKVMRYEINGMPLVLFNTQKLKDQNIKNFIEFNFGTVDNLCCIKKTLENVKTIAFEITDEKSLIDALNKLHEYQGGFVFPIQLSSSDCPLNEIKREERYVEEELEVIVGDSTNDILYQWNKPLSVHYWKRSHINSFWMPKSLSESQEFLKTFSLLVRRYSKSHSSNGFNRLNVISFSLDKKKLQKVLEALNISVFYYRKTTKLSKQAYPNYEQFFSFDRLKNEMQYFRFNSSEEMLNIKSPISENSIKNCGYWMTDLYINKGAEGLYYSNLETWLQLPSKNILKNSIFPSSPSRITMNGLPSCLVRMPMSEPISQPGNSIKFKLISEDEMFRALMSSNCKALQDYSLNYTNDARGKIIQREYISDAEISSSGKYLIGFVGNFQGLDGANQFLSQKYWVKVFDILSGKNLQKDSNLLESLSNKIKDDIGRGKISISDPKNLASYLLDLAKKYDLPSRKGVSYEIFIKNLGEKNKELNDLNKSKRKKIKIASDLEKDLKEEMDYLLELGILLAGFYSKCPNCGTSEWRSLDETKQEIRCRGCNFTFSIETNEKWSYRLNTLVQNGILHYNLAPVVLCLSKLMQRARHFFSFYPCMDVFAPKKDLPFTDVDLICVVDGKLILGECKLTADEFSEKDFKNMDIVATALHPNEVVFSAPLGKLSSVNQEKFNKLEEKLDPLGIKVKWVGENYVPHVDRII